MSVADKFGLADCGLAEELLAAWPAWVEQYPAMGVVPDPGDLRGWLNVSGREEKNGVLAGLACLARVQGGNDLTAARALGWVLMPAAKVMAADLRRLSPEIDDVVAGQLWLVIRQNRWRPDWMVAPLIMRRTRSAVLAELGADPSIPSLPVVSDEFLSALPGPVAEPTSMEELLDVLDWACAEGLVLREDRALLLSLVDAARRVGRVRDGGQAGLMSVAATEAVAFEWGLTARTVRRRAHRSIAALQSAAHRYTQVA